MTADSHAFVSAEARYARFRPRYPHTLYQLLADRFALDGTQLALDLGCGPGTVALELAALVHTVIAVDPAAGMLQQGRTLARERGVDNVQWQRGDSTALHDLGLPPLDLVVMAKSFHWADRVQVLQDLDTLTTAQAGMSSCPPARPAPHPCPLGIGDRRRPSRLPRHRPTSRAGIYPEPAETYETTVRRSPFSKVDVTAFDQLVARTTRELIGLQLSNSYSTPAHLGPRRQAFEEDLRRALLTHDPSSRYEETIRTEVLVAVR